MRRTPSEGAMLNLIAEIVKQAPRKYELTQEMVDYWHDHKFELNQKLKFLKDRPDAQDTVIHKDYALEYNNETIISWQNKLMQKIIDVLESDMNESLQERKDQNGRVRSWRRMIHKLFFNKNKLGEEYPYKQYL